MYKFNYKRHDHDMSQIINDDRILHKIYVYRLSIYLQIYVS